MKSVIHKTKEFLFETRKQFFLNRNRIKKDISVDLGFRKLFFSQTFSNNKVFIEHLLSPHTGINVAVYVQSPQILIAQSEDRLVLDASVCYRLDLGKFQPKFVENNDVIIRKINTDDIEGVNKVYAEYGMYTIDEKTVINNTHEGAVTYFVAENKGVIAGIVIGVDHARLFNSPEKGSSLWGLAVVKSNFGKGIGRSLINHIIEYYQTKGLSYIDLYVDYNNKRAISLYIKLGFRKIPRFYMTPKTDAAQH